MSAWLLLPSVPPFAYIQCTCVCKLISGCIHESIITIRHHCWPSFTSSRTIYPPWTIRTNIRNNHHSPSFITILNSPVAILTILVHYQPLLPLQNHHFYRRPSFHIDLVFQMIKIESFDQMIKTKKNTTSFIKHHKKKHHVYIKHKKKTPTNDLRKSPPIVIAKFPCWSQTWASWSFRWDRTWPPTKRWPTQRRRPCSRSTRATTQQSRRQRPCGEGRRWWEAIWVCYPLPGWLMVG